MEIWYTLLCAALLLPIRINVCSVENHWRLCPAVFKNEMYVTLYVIISKHAPFVRREESIRICKVCNWSEVAIDARAWLKGWYVHGRNMYTVHFLLKAAVLMSCSVSSYKYNHNIITTYTRLQKVEISAGLIVRLIEFWVEFCEVDNSHERHLPYRFADSACISAFVNLIPIHCVDHRLGIPIWMI